MNEHAAAEIARIVVGNIAAIKSDGPVHSDATAESTRRVMLDDAAVYFDRAAGERAHTAAAVFVVVADDRAAVHYERTFHADTAAFRIVFYRMVTENRTAV